MGSPRLLLLAVPLAVGCAPSPSARQSMPPSRRPAPTVHRLDPGAEGRNADARREWMEAMHRTAPGVDWRAIERDNGLAAMARRRSFAAGGRSSSVPGSWRELGSRNQAGRMYATALSSSGTQFYSGSALGGVWRADLDGSHWTAIGDTLYGGATDLAALPAPGGGPDIVLRLSNGMLHRSTDDGLLWDSPAGLDHVNDVSRLRVLPDSAHTVLILAFDPDVQVGWAVYRSTDLGASFTRTWLLKSWKGDLWSPRDVPGPVWVYKMDQLHVSYDGGVTFSPYGNPLPFTSGAVHLAATEGNPPTFDLARKKNSVWELWRSNDGAQTWTHVRDLGDFWGAFEASSQDPDLLVWGGVEASVSRDGGQTSQVVNTWGSYYGNPAIYLHADIQSIRCFPDPSAPQGEVWYLGTDGGVYRSEDGLNTVANLSLSGLGVSQYYSTLTSVRDSSYVAAGAQDQGYQRAVLGTPGNGGGPWADFAQLISGDYGHLTSSDGTHDLVYSVYPGFVLVQEGETNPVLVSYPNFPLGESYLWMPPILADPTDPEAFFFCASHLWRYKRSTYVYWQATQFSGYDFQGILSALCFSPLDPARAWAATTDGRLFYSVDGGLNWNQSTQTGPGSHYFYGTSLVASSSDVNTVWVAGSGYSSPPVKRSTDGGVSWQAERNGLPDTLIYDLCEAPDGSGAMFAGSESGAWMWRPDSRSWVDITVAGSPITLYWSCEAVPSRNLVRFGTYGRGIWDFELASAGAFPYGEHMGGANTVELSSISVPAPGLSAAVSVQKAPPSASGLLLVADRSDQVAAGGGTLLIPIQGSRQLPFSTDGDGLATLSTILPISTPVGSEFFLQAFVSDPSQPGGWAMSNGLRLVVGE